MLQANPIVKDLILVGGGHTHALVIKMWAMNPLHGVRLTLISPNWQTPYSGMLPGLLAGHYNTDAIHIDLRKVCTWANVRFIEDHVQAINRQNKTLSLKQHPTIRYDTLSIDIGATPDLSTPGFKAFTVGIKPIDLFYNRYLACIKRCHTESHKNLKPFRVMVIGGGAGGVEVVLAMANALSTNKKIHLSLVVRGDHVLSGYPKQVKQSIEQALKALNVSVIRNFNVVRIEENSLTNSQNETLPADEIFLCTHVIAAKWPKISGLACDSDGFISVNKFLQSTNSKDIFAVGDIAHMTASPRPKAGVYAVRQAPVLVENLKRSLLKKDLKPFIPQDSFLSLLSLGHKKAIASRNRRAVTSPVFQSLLWRLKDSIDQKFMAQFSALTPLNMPSNTIIDDRLINEVDYFEIKNHAIRCAGCGSKVGSSILKNVLSSIIAEHQFKPEDAAIIDTPATTLLQTVDQITSPIDDPYVFGKIATLHALSDIFAMNAQANSAQVLLNLPFSSSKIQTQEITLVMKGVLEVLKSYHCKLLGGHTAEAKELSLGLVVNAEPFKNKQLFYKSKLKLGDTLVLTKPIGTGVILAAQMQTQATSNWEYQGDWHNAAITNMLRSNQPASRIFSAIGTYACTDVTGFGLVGHLCEMLEASQCQAEISLETIPLIKGALALTKKGVKSSLYPQNLEVLQKIKVSKRISDHPSFPLLFDPQTSGGLLAGLNAEAFTKLTQQNEIEYYVIGKITADQSDWDLNII